MRYEEFANSIQKQSQPPEGISPALQALWWDGKGDWEKAHALSQSAASRAGDAVHAYLHRKEGDEGNASYWYSRSGKPFFEGSLEAEWESLAREFAS